MPNVTKSLQKLSLKKQIVQIDETVADMWRKVIFCTMYIVKFVVIQVQVRVYFTAVMWIRTSFNRIRIWIRIFKKLIESDFWSGPSCPDPDPDPTKKERIWISNRIVNKFFVLSFFIVSQQLWYWTEQHPSCQKTDSPQLLEDLYIAAATGKLHRSWKKTATNSSCQRTATQ